MLIKIIYFSFGQNKKIGKKINKLLKQVFFPWFHLIKKEIRRYFVAVLQTN